MVKMHKIKDRTLRDDVVPETEIYEFDETTRHFAKPSALTDRELEQLYDSGEFHVITERNDFLLPQILDFVGKNQWITMNPEYQRRKRWDNVKKSRLIESILMNVPVPPIFLYEHDLARYEVMDGQQRLNAIIEFYNNEFKLRGLELWSALIGKTFSQCPPRIKRGLERRKLSAVILQVESERHTLQPEVNLRRMVFERLNTGGEKLNPQEIRNALYAGPFNRLILELSRTKAFTDAWGIPAYDEYERGDFVALKRRNHTLYKTMHDCQLVLRFFAFREVKNIKGSVQSILDSTMKMHQHVDSSAIEKLKQVFLSRLKTCLEIFGKYAFRIVTDSDAPGRLSAPLYDAQMVAVDRLWDHRREVAGDRTGTLRRLRTLLMDETVYEVVVGRPNTAKAIQSRIDILVDLLGGHLQ